MLEFPELLALWQKLFLMKMCDENMEIHMLHYEHDSMNAMPETKVIWMILSSKNQSDLIFQQSM
jgi:hypothetical protein